MEKKTNGYHMTQEATSRNLMRDNIECIQSLCIKTVA